MVSDTIGSSKKEILKEFRDPALTQKLLKKIEEEVSSLKKDVKIMEVCGTHTRVISAYGFRSLLPEKIELLSGPGCPTCVTPQRHINMCIALAEEGLEVATFGDMLRVPGAEESLEDVRARGGKIKVVESPLEALGCDVFFAIGFDTTAPNTAVAVKKGLTILNCHKRFVPAMVALLNMGDLEIDGFLNPGHVSTIIGTEPYKVLDVPQVIAGFEPVDVLAAILHLIKMIKKNEKGVVNRYTRLVRYKGNLRAKKVLDDVFDVGDSLWRGLGTIPGSGFKLKKEFEEQDAELIYSDVLKKVDDRELNPACKCSEVLRGIRRPEECPLFETVCTPSNPQGPCMVSMEGACGIAYEFREIK
ncbi:MAG TPA: hydrogenase formation protein HypD [Thermoplasmata archaeon]|nr:hydrogenase formation protein HypD [Thermoplasmata archaeon]